MSGQDRMWSDLERPPLLMPVQVGGGWRVEVVAATASTNADVVARAHAGERPGLVVVAEEQTAGRGRLDRTWCSPPRAGLTFSALLTATPSPWVPLLAGVAVVRGLRAAADVAARLKWPNDVLLGPDDAKVAGVLCEVVTEGLVVLGIGLNVTTRVAELPTDRPATSLALAGARTTDRLTILRAVLRALATPAGAVDYRGLCATIGRRVALTLPGGDLVEGVADGVDDEGRLVVEGTPYAAADVVHLR